MRRYSFQKNFNKTNQTSSQDTSCQTVKASWLLHTDTTALTHAKATLRNITTQRNLFQARDKTAYVGGIQSWCALRSSRTQLERIQQTRKSSKLPGGGSQGTGDIAVPPASGGQPGLHNIILSQNKQKQKTGCSSVLV